jgi:hypothetical protein
MRNRRRRERRRNSFHQLLRSTAEGDKTTVEQRTEEASLFSTTAPRCRSDCAETPFYSLDFSPPGWSAILVRGHCRHAPQRWRRNSLLHNTLRPDAARRDMGRCSIKRCGRWSMRLAGRRPQCANRVLDTVLSRRRRSLSEEDRFSRSTFFAAFRWASSSLLTDQSRPRATRSR